jgi:N-acetylglucosaminyldiphosphoundecaprenol N-acetyl-beta-D-mannosaminyltransferase
MPDSLSAAYFAGGTAAAAVDYRSGELPVVPIMGFDVAAVSEDELIRHVTTAVDRGVGGWICTANLDILRQCHRSPEARRVVSSASIVLADGMPLVWASILQGTPVPERVAGSTLTSSLAAAAAEVGASVMLIGGNPGTAEESARRLEQANPGLNVVGTLCPPFGFESSAEAISEIEDALIAAAPDIVFVGLGFPKQEHLIERLQPLAPSAWFIACGVSFSFISGEFRRAPRMVQRLGLEWLSRLVQEPGRLWRRYLADLPFLVRLLAQSLGIRLS